MAAARCAQVLLRWESESKREEIAERWKMIEEKEGRQRRKQEGGRRVMAETMKKNDKCDTRLREAEYEVWKSAVSTWRKKPGNRRMIATEKGRKKRKGGMMVEERERKKLEEWCLGILSATNSAGPRSARFGKRSVFQCPNQAGPGKEGRRRDGLWNERLSRGRNSTISPSHSPSLRPSLRRLFAPLLGCKKRPVHICATWICRCLMLTQISLDAGPVEEISANANFSNVVNKVSRCLSQPSLSHDSARRRRIDLKVGLGLRSSQGFSTRAGPQLIVRKVRRRGQVLYRPMQSAAASSARSGLLQGLGRARWEEQDVTASRAQKPLLGSSLDSRRAEAKNDWLLSPHKSLH